MSNCILNSGSESDLHFFQSRVSKSCTCGKYSDKDISTPSDVYTHISDEEFYHIVDVLRGIKMSYDQADYLRDLAKFGIASLPPRKA